MAHWWRRGAAVSSAYRAAAALALASLFLPAAALAADDAVPPRSFEDVLICGALLMMGLYHLVIFALRRRDRASLALALYCLLRAFYALCSDKGGLGLLRFLPHLDPDFAFSAGLVGLTMSLPLLQAFFREVFPRRFPRAGLLALTAAALACVAAGLGFGFKGPVLHGQLLYLSVVMLYTMVNLVRAWRAGDSGAGLLLAGYGALTLCGVNDVLLGEEVASGIWLAPIGTLAFVLAQSGLLAYRFSQDFKARERLSAELETQNVRLEQEIARRTRLQRQLDTVAEEERRFVSRALHDGLCQDLTAARLHCSLWRASSKDGTAVFRKVSDLLESAVDQAYQLSRGLWPMGREIADLPAALRDLGETLAAEHGLAVSVRCEDAALRAVEREHLFQIAKEALTNVVKHARARRAEIALATGAGLRLVVEDDGIGLEAGTPTKGGLGTRIMAHHAQALGGTLTLSSRPEGGTRVELVLPDPV